MIIIKKYKNRKLYDTTKSSYITLKELSSYIKKDLDIKVIDDKTNEDLTKNTKLTAIFNDLMKNGYNEEKLIGFYKNEKNQIQENSKK